MLSSWSRGPHARLPLQATPPVALVPSGMRCPVSASCHATLEGFEHRKQNCPRFKGLLGQVRMAIQSRPPICLTPLVIAEAACLANGNAALPGPAKSTTPHALQEADGSLTCAAPGMVGWGGPHIHRDQHTPCRVNRCLHHLTVHSLPLLHAGQCRGTQVVPRKNLQPQEPCDHGVGMCQAACRALRLLPGRAWRHCGQAASAVSRRHAVARQLAELS